MQPKIQSYQEKYKEQLIKLFNDFHEYIISIDPLKRNIKSIDFAEKYLTRVFEKVNKKEGQFFIAVDKEQVVGFVAAIIERLSKDDQIGVISTVPGRVLELYVVPEYSKQDIASQLMLKVEKYFKEQGCDVYKVEALSSDKSAKQFYEGQGFEARTIDYIKKLT